MKNTKKKSYEPPKLMDFGRISKITSHNGMTFLTDTSQCGSNEKGESTC